MGAVIDMLMAPARLHTRREVLDRPSPVPQGPGVYAWYFDEPPPGVPVEGCHLLDAGVLLYVGIAPKQPPSNGRPPSRQTLRSRLRYHYRGNAEGSTLRLTLGCHLAEHLGIALRRVGSGTRLLNIQGNARNEYSPTLTALRAKHRAAARALPVVQRRSVR